MAGDMRRKAEKAQKAEHERIQTAKRQHLKDMAAERRAARQAIVAASGPKQPWPIHKTAKRG